MLDYNGVVVATSGIEYGLSLKHIHEVQQALKGKPISLLRERVPGVQSYLWTSTSRDTGLRVFVSMPVINNHRIVGVVLLSRTPRSVKKAIYDQIDRVVIMIVLLITIVVLLSIFTSRTISKPLASLIEQTKLIANERQQHNLPLAKPITYEVEELSHAFLKMAERVEHRSQYIRNFALSVSHEFKTPLTSIQGAIELLVTYTDEMPVDKRDRFLKNIQQDSLRLKKLVNRLLELARADVLVPEDDEANLIGTLSELREKFEAAGLNLSCTHPGNSLHVPLPKAVLESILINLLENSHQHNASQVNIDIQTQNGTMITLHNNGDSISESNMKQIFTPFFTTNRENGGTGLGLPIVKSLLQAHRGDIEVVPVTSGACLKIQLPDRVADSDG